MIISRDKTITDDEYNRLQWSDLTADPDTLTEVFAGRQIVSAEPIDYPQTSGIVYAILDGEQMFFVNVSIDDDLLYGNLDDCEKPLVLSVSEFIGIEPDPAEPLSDSV